MAIRKFTINKSKNQVRTIYLVDSDRKERLKKYLPILEAILASQDRVKCNYAFTHGRNCVSHALRHKSYNFTLSVDIKNFFDSIDIRLLKNKVPSDILEDCLIDGAPRQGLPTSPILSSIAFNIIDEEILKKLKHLTQDVTYTRYADDLYFSFNDSSLAAQLFDMVLKKISCYGFKLNLYKTKVQDSRNGRRVITGIAVDENGVYATRKTKKRLRAALHQNNILYANGLKEWTLCKLPKK